MSQHQNQNQNQNQNLPLVPKSEAGVKPFAIRQYVLACRDRNISQNWPYEEKHLQLCLKSGLMEKELLPPLEPLNGFSKMHSPNDNNSSKETDSCNAEVPQECNYKVSNHHPSSQEEGKYSDHHNTSNDSAKFSQPEETCSLSGSTNLHNNSPPLKAVKCKRRRRKGKCKKRFMVDILAMAQHSTLEETDGMNKFFYAQTVVEGCHEQAVDEDSCRKGGSEDHGMANGDVTPKELLLLKFKLNGCNVIGN